MGSARSGTARRTWYAWLIPLCVTAGVVAGVYLVVRPGSSRPDQAAPTVATTTSFPATTSTVPETTTTVDPALAPAQDYFQLLARGDVASVEQAAEQSTSYAAAFAEMIWLLDLDDFVIQSEEQGEITACYPTGPGEIAHCAHYSDFSLSSGRLAHFDVDDRPLDKGIWRGSGRGWCHSYGECNWDDPASDPEGLYMMIRYAYLAPAGTLVLAWHAQTGERDLDVIMGQDGRHTSYVTDSAGTQHYADWCVSRIADAELSSLGLRLAKHQEGYLTCSFPEFGLPGAETAVTATLVIDWGGRHEDVYELPELAD